ncbi:DNA replication regulator SLD3-domain-containing protein [Biscogniauxia marginata]|nr:DNA replication regulator SLD3-domain-containing protein [Biscogniauxia marginata]
MLHIGTKILHAYGSFSMSSRPHSLDASRRPSSIPTPSSPDADADARLDNDPNDPGITSSQTKRSHDASAMEDLLGPSIIIKPHPPNLSVKPRSLQPLMLLPREHFQLSFLDLSSPYGSFESSRCFESNIKILDLEGRMGSRSVVLIARLETDKTIYVIERQKNSLYTLCQLGPWVDLELLCELATVSLPHLINRRPNFSSDSTTLQPLITPRLHHEHKKRRLAIEAIQSLVKKPARSRSISSLSQPVEATRPPTLIQGTVDTQSRSTTVTQDVGPSRGWGSQARTESQAALAPAINDPSAILNANDIFDSIRTQYLEALYHSMGSLAYFAKGPLSRARAAFHMDCDSTLEMNDLIDFLKSLVMTTMQIDKKYRGAIPGVIHKMKTVFQDSDNEQDSSKTKKRRSKKMKLGKDGLYPTEEEHIRKWWTVHKPQPKDDDSMTIVDPHETKLQISYLRSRETQLQMIIILEILALQPLIASTSTESQLPGLPSAGEPVEKKPKETPMKRRDKHNLPFLLDVHADRLCIWQSTALDEINMMDDSQANHEAEPNRSLRITSDPLKDFCVDIIVPFFSARLPEHCDSINRKLGGPVMVSPPKSRPQKPEATTKPRTKPGAAAKRPLSSKTPRTLESVLTRESERHRRSMSRGPSGVIALMRSASTTTLPILKRETSEPLSAMSVPKADSTTSQKSSRPPSSGAPKRKSEEEKAKKDALFKAELKDAISTLRRPNRDVVGKAMAEAAEKRTTTSLSQLRKSKKPTQHPRFQNVVKATPIGNRFRDALGDGMKYRSTRVQEIGSVVEEHISSSASMVPASAPRKRNHEAAFDDEESPARPSYRKLTHQIEATPARSSTLNRDFLSVPGPDEGVVLASSPVMSRKTSQMKPLAARKSTLGHRDSGIGMPSSPGGVELLAETPVKPRYGGGSLDQFVTVTPAKNRSSDKVKDNPSATSKNARGDGDADVGKENDEKKISIFQRLGWDDYDDLF